MKRHHRLAFALAIAGALCGAGAAVAQDADAPPRERWSFSGPFGLYDQAQLQRGFKIYQEVCSNCHSLKLVSFRNLADPGGPGFTEAQAATIAATFQVQDGPNDQGKMFKRPGKISDNFPPPFANDQAARRHRACRLDRRARHHAMARYVAGAFGKLPAAVPAIPVHLFRRGYRARLSRLARADRRLCDRGAHSHPLLFRILFRDPPAPGIVRENQAVAEFDFGIGAAAWCSSRSIGAGAGRAGVEEPLR